MEIKVAKNAGFCFGVKRAINIALNAARHTGNIYMLGDIVHNETVVKKLEEAGVGKIKRLNKGAGKILLIRAHGAQEATFLKAKKAGYKIIDATCPMVKGIHAIAKNMEKNKRQVIIIGEKAHDEVRGIVGQLKKKPIVISSIADIKSELTTAPPRKAGIVVQSTQEEEKVLGIVKRLSKIVPDLMFKNTICNPTKIKQTEAKTLPLKSEVFIVIGSKSSANTKRLYEIAKKLNKRTYWVNSAGGLKREWFARAKKVGITAGASTPEESIKEVIKEIKKF